MKGLDGLIRLHRWKLDEQRRTLAGLETLAEDFRRQIAALDDSLRREREVARIAPDSAQTYAAYLAASRARRERLARSLAEVERQMLEVHESVRHAFQDLKRYELAQEAEDRRTAEVARRMEQSRTDEVGLNLYRRSNGDGRGH
jgi:flagellar protein FliJ